MKIYYMAIDLAFTASNQARDTLDAFDQFTTNVMDELIELEESGEGVRHPDITANLAQRELSVLMGVEADTWRDAERLLSANVRTALHAAGCRTAGWSTPVELPEPREMNRTEAHEYA